MPDDPGVEREMIAFDGFGERQGYGLKRHFLGGSSLRYIDMRNRTLIPLPGNIQIAIATAEFPDIGLAINAGADNIAVFFAITGSQPAGARHIAVALLIGEQTFEQLKDALGVLVK